VNGLRTISLVTLVAGIVGATSVPAQASSDLRQRDDTASLQSETEVTDSFATLRRVDDHPLYEMSYVGDYDSLYNVVPVELPSSFGCSLFAAFGEADHPLFARNFDWDPDAALLVHTDPPDGYASVAIVDMLYLGIEPGQDPTQDPEARDHLLNAPLAPIDGVNEMGLAIGLAADESGSADADPTRSTVSGLRIMRLVLDNAATVEEANGVFEQYNLDFTGGPALHYLVADAGGASAVVEFVDGEMVVIRAATSWQALTNFRQANASANEFQNDARWATAADALESAGGAVDPTAALGILEAVHQGHTQWSVVYDLATGDGHVVMGQQWANVYEFDL